MLLPLQLVPVELQALILFSSLVMPSRYVMHRQTLCTSSQACVAATALYYFTDDRHLLLCAVVSLMPTH